MADSSLIDYGDSEYEREWAATNMESTPSENGRTGARTVAETETSGTDADGPSVDKTADESQ